MSKPVAFQVRMSESEHARMILLASLAGVSLSEFARRRLTASQPAQERSDEPEATTSVGDDANAAPATPEASQGILGMAGDTSVSQADASAGKDEVDEPQATSQAGDENDALVAQGSGLGGLHVASGGSADAAPFTSAGKDEVTDEQQTSQAPGDNELHRGMEHDFAPPNYEAVEEAEASPDKASVELVQPASPAVRPLGVIRFTTSPSCTSSGRCQRLRIACCEACRRNNS